MGLDNANVNANDMEKFGGDRSEWADWSFEFILQMEAHGLGYILDDSGNVSEPNSLKKEKLDCKNQSKVSDFWLSYDLDDSIFNYVSSKNRTLLSFLFDLREHALNRLIVQRIFQIRHN